MHQRNRACQKMTAHQVYRQTAICPYSGLPSEETARELLACRTVWQALDHDPNGPIHPSDVEFARSASQKSPAVAAVFAHSALHQAVLRPSSCLDLRRQAALSRAEILVYSINR